MLLFTLFSLSVLLVSSLYLGIFVWIFLSVNPPFLIHSFLHHISTIHHNLTNLLLWHLSLFTFEEGGGRNLLSYNLHCSGHILINVADKAIAHQLMRRQKATPNYKLLLGSLILSLQIIVPTWNTSESFDSSLPLLGPWTAAFPQLYCNSSTPSSILEHPQYILCYLKFHTIYIHYITQR